MRVYSILIVASVISVCMTSNGLLLAYEANPTLTTKVSQLFSIRCSKCHASGTNSDQEPFLNDSNAVINALQNSAFADLSKPEKSAVLARLTNVDDPMPPSGGMLSKSEVDLVKRWIESASSRNVERKIIRDAQVLQSIVSDLNSLPESSRKFFRYLTLHNLHNAGDSKRDLSLYRAAVSKLLNSLSYQGKIAVPLALGPDSLVIRIDLREFGWSPTKWRMVSRHYPYGLSGVDQRSESIIEKYTSEQMAVVRADWFVFVCAQAPLYHELLDIPDGENAVEVLEKKLGVDLVKNLSKGLAIRAGFRESGVSRANRLIERHDLGIHAGSYWISYDFSPLNAGAQQDLFIAPLGPSLAHLTRDRRSVFDHDGGEIIFTLPNGLQAYMLVTATGKRLSRAPIEIVQNSLRRDRVILNGISCIGCHSSGMKSPPGKSLETIVDEIGPVTTKLAPDFQSRQLLKKLYASPEILRVAMKKDSKRFQDANMQATNPFIQGNTEEPIYKLYHRFLRPISSETFASEFNEENSLLGILERDTDDRGILLISSMLNREIGFPRKSFYDTFQQIAKELYYEPIPFEFLAVEEFGDERPLTSTTPRSDSTPVEPSNYHDRGKPIMVKAQPRAEFTKKLSVSSTQLPGGGTLTVSINSPEITVGQVLEVRIKVTRECHIRAIHFGADGSTTQMFPNALQKNDKVSAHKELVILDKSLGFQWITDGQTGPEHIIVVASNRPFNDESQATTFKPEEPFREVRKSRYMSRGQLKLRPLAKPTPSDSTTHRHTKSTNTAEVRVSYVLSPAK